MLGARPYWPTHKHADDLQNYMTSIIMAAYPVLDLLTSTIVVETHWITVIFCQYFHYLDKHLYILPVFNRYSIKLLYPNTQK